MGDAGSQFLGHYLAIAAILLTDSTRTTYSPLLALFIWGVPLLDTIGVMGQRLLEGRSPFVGDRNHLHHKLLAGGLTHGQAVSVIYLAHGLMVSCAYLLRWQSDVVLFAVYLLFAAMILTMFVLWKQQPASVTVITEPTVHAWIRRVIDSGCGSENGRSKRFNCSFLCISSYRWLYRKRFQGMQGDCDRTVDCGSGVPGGRYQNSVGGAGRAVCREHVPDVLR